MPVTLPLLSYHSPDDIVFVEGIPHTATGKILKTALRDQFKSYRFPNAAA